jgi:alanyl-tRNA synthetase
VNKSRLPIERLWFTVYQDDDEAEWLWIETGAAAGAGAALWQEGQLVGHGRHRPLRSHSEIHYYWGDLATQANRAASTRTMSTWRSGTWSSCNTNAKPDGALIPLPAPSVDTGAGLERLASILQGKDNNYDTDAFTPIMERIQQLARPRATPERKQNHLSLSRHRRPRPPCTFMIGDGVLPGNEGRNYVLRMILRRAARFGKLIGFDDPFLAQVADVVIDQMGGHYTDLPAKRDFILKTITDEEERFHRTLNTGLALLEDLIDRLRAQGEHGHSWPRRIPPVGHLRLPDGPDAGHCYQDSGFSIDEAGFRSALDAAKEQSRDRARDKIVQDVSVYSQLLSDLQEQGSVGPEGVKHLIYENVAAVETTLAGIIQNGEIVVEAHAGAQVELVLPETPFYVESGGQMSDTGEIYYWPEDLDTPVWVVEVSDTRRRTPGLIVHIGTVRSGTLRVGDPAECEIDVERRWDIMRNHTGTHVLHAALRERLGKHVHQAGSLVAPERLRFDFTHGQPLSKDDLIAIERRAGEIIMSNYPVNIRWTSRERAIQEGAMALFGEKYGDEVRVVSFGEDEGVSMELCGGMHVDSTAEIGSFRIVSEGSVSAGVRRIEIITGRYAELMVEERLDALERAADLLHCKPVDVVEAVNQLQEQNQQLQRELAQLRQKLAQQETAVLLDQAIPLDGFKVLAVQVNVGSVETMRQMTDWLRDKLGSSVVMVGSIIDDKPMLVAAVTQDLIARGMHAGNLVRDASKLIGGGGGGKPNLAQAGGKDSSKLGDALKSVADWVRQNIK